MHVRERETHRRKDEVTAFAIGMLVPGGGQLYAEDWGLGLYLASLGLSSGFVWQAGQLAVAVIMAAFAWVGGLVLVPHAVRKGEDAGRRQDP